MPAAKKSRSSGSNDQPSTVARSGKKARETWGATHDSAAEQYGDGERAHRTAYSALKHTHEKVGDHWEPKDRKGPSDPRASNARAREGHGKTFGGVDYAGNTKQELYERAKGLGVRGRSRMSKEELAEAIARKQ